MDSNTIKCHQVCRNEKALIQFRTFCIRTFIKAPSLSLQKFFTVHEWRHNWKLTSYQIPDPDPKDTDQPCFAYHHLSEKKHKNLTWKVQLFFLLQFHNPVARRDLSIEINHNPTIK